jgi:hypothetical protein
MITKSKIAIAASALALAASLTIPSSQAEARRWGWGGWALGAGIASGVMLGAAYATPTYAYGYRRCPLVRQYDSWGRYIGKARVCYY